jgi:hypothetical protein
MFLMKFTDLVLIYFFIAHFSCPLTSKYKPIGIYFQMHMLIIYIKNLKLKVNKRLQLRRPRLVNHKNY